MSLLLPGTWHTGHHKHQAPVCSLPSRHLGWQVRSRERQHSQLKDTRSNRHSPHSASYEGVVTSHMAQTATSQQIDAPEVSIFTTVGCPYCKKAKGILQEENIAYGEADVSSDTSLRQELQSITGQKTVPQIFFGGKHIGGADDLASLRYKGKLTSTLDEHRGSDALPKALALAVAEAGQQGSSKAVTPAGLPLEEYNKLKGLADSLRDRYLAGSDARSRTFSFQDFSSWIKTSAASEESPEVLTQELLTAQILTVEGGSESNSWSGAAARHAVLRFVADAPKPKLGQPLNEHFQWYGRPRPALKVAQQLRESVLALYDKHLAAEGKSVDYKGLAADPGFQLFVDATAELQKLEVSAFTREERMAFWINIYNILVVHALVAFGPASNTLARLNWFANIKYVIGGQQYSSNDIEHGVLRSNKPSPANILSLVGLSKFAPKTFKQGDPRMSQVVDPEDPRIHFALVCGAKSCPPIKVYTPESLEEGLSSAASAFVESEVEVVPSERKLVMSKIFQWYGGDFGSKADIVALLQKYLTGNARKQLESISADPDSIEFSYREYDWSQNSS